MKLIPFIRNNESVVYSNLIVFLKIRFNSKYQQTINVVYISMFILIPAKKDLEVTITSKY